MSEILSLIRSELFSLQDEQYRDFMCPLIPTVAPYTVIGVRVPQLKKLAKRICGCADLSDFTSALPHEYYEEYCLHAFIICEMKDFHQCIAEINKLLPHIDNWAVCDGLRPRCFKNNKAALLNEIDPWLKSDHPYTVRFAVEMLMVHFLDGEFSTEHMEKISLIRSGDYYVNMMLAWYFATALDKQRNAALKYLEERRLSAWVHNKAISKAVESYRIPPELKGYLKQLKRR